ncbi:hypothetical protein BDW59DRAFT_157724 [Aspergillus cavernicola]|uniref:Yeast cell wall synthesis Kre9/Knh1-like N-terminal domain-containing protein n=1 Tax=Aspergillus cavernicola TaxID=176166 RepID=A0ABR4IVJ4_9EURO
MYLLKPLLATWACLAQVSIAGVAFTRWPATVYTGQPAILGWNGDPNAPATIILRKGPADNLKTLKVLTTQAGGGSFTWIPEESLIDGTDYALQIEQDGSINYSGLVTLAHQPGWEPSLPVSQNTPHGLSSNSVPPPIGGMRTDVQKGNNGYISVQNSTSPQFNMTSSKGTAPTKSNEGTSFRLASPEIILGALAAVIFFAL